MAGTAASFLAARSRYERVEIPDRGIAIWVRGLTGRERDHFETVMVNRSDGDMSKLGTFRAELVQLGAVQWDKDSPPEDHPPALFTPEQLDELREVDAAVLDPVATAIMRLSGLTDESRQRSRARLGEAKPGGSGSGSPGT